MTFLEKKHFWPQNHFSVFSVYYAPERMHTSTLNIVLLIDRSNLH
jgi:hypothetical protein